MKPKIEFIESYIRVGNDYQWNDNHGELIRCEDCKYAKPIDSEWLECQHDKRVMKPNGFCSWADPKEIDNE